MRDGRFNQVRVKHEAGLIASAIKQIESSHARPGTCWRLWSPMPFRQTGLRVFVSAKTTKAKHGREADAGGSHGSCTRRHEGTKARRDTPAGVFRLPTQ